VAEIICWSIELNSIPDGQWPVLLQFLDDDERPRAARFAFERHAHEYMAAHALKRLLLSTLTGLPTSRLKFATSPKGKPHLVESSDVSFSIAHCDGRVACAACFGIPVGVDVEPAARDVDLESLRRFLAAEEVGWVLGTPADRRADTLLRIWTLKEAFAKATGDGLSDTLRDIAFELDPVRMRVRAPSITRADRWRFEQQKIGTHWLALGWMNGLDPASVRISEMQFETLFKRIEADRV
jgi:4'-phosphopantetheinyl transferase